MIESCGKSSEFYFQNDAAIAKTSMSKIALSSMQIINMMTQLQSKSYLPRNRWLT